MLCDGLEVRRTRKVRVDNELVVILTTAPFELFNSSHSNRSPDACEVPDRATPGRLRAGVTY
jgi:hypothetical protein